MEEIKDNIIHENIVFEGGGVLGFAYCGAIKELETRGLLKNFKRFAGTSIGSLFAILLCIGFTADQIIDASSIINLDKVRSGCLVSHIFNLVKYYGIYSSSSIEEQFKNIISIKVDPYITLQNLFEHTGKDLVIVSCCLNRKKPVYFHHAAYPDVRLLDALMASISLPFVFRPRKMNIFGTTDYFVDGIIENYPIWVFNDLDKLAEGKIEDMEKNEVSPKTLGLKLLGKWESNTREVYEGRKKLNRIYAFTLQLYNTLVMHIERSIISESYIKQTIPISSLGISFVNFELTKQQIESLFEEGKSGVQKYYN